MWFVGGIIIVYLYKNVVLRLLYNEIYQDFYNMILMGGITELFRPVLTKPEP